MAKHFITLLLGLIFLSCSHSLSDFDCDCEILALSINPGVTCHRTFLDVTVVTVSSVFMMERLFRGQRIRDEIGSASATSVRIYSSKKILLGCS
jgi:hypothetical protein